MGNITSTFDIEQACKANNETFDILDCLPSFESNPTNNATGVLALGGVLPGGLKTEPDVAGIGVLLAFIIPSVVALLIGAVLAIRPINDRILPKRWRSDFIARTAPARPECERGQYKGPPSIPRRRQRTHHGNASSHWTHNHLNNDSVPLKPHHTTYPEHHALPYYPYQTRPSPLNFSSIDIESSNHGPPSSSDAPEPDEEKKKPGSEIFYDMLQAALQAITDSQILLSLAFNISFRFSGKCDMLLYHLRVAINITEVACANAFLSLLLIRDYWKAPVSAIIRLGVLGLNIWMVFDILYIQQKLGYDAETLPPPERNDSLILLKASCFLDKDLADAVFANHTNTTPANSTSQFFATVITNATTNSTLLTNEEYNAVGALSYDKNPREWIFVISLWVNLALTFVYAGFRFLRSMTPNKLSHFIFYSYAAATWLFCLFVLSFNASYIFNLRRWVGGSGWFDPAESENYVGLGQWVAILAMVGIVFAFFDQLRAP